MDYIISFLSTPAVLLGLVAMIGLLAHNKTGREVLTGTSKTIIGFLIFYAGGTILTGALQIFITLFQTGF
ncbi:PTS transporter subunit IIC, partial [Enterococcus faecalis]|uniref:PTS transporter subunit IIC n=1 Tax=Enterococcus faecalis TaxID=1351 RepID=UPI003CC6890C